MIKFAILALALVSSSALANICEPRRDQNGKIARDRVSVTQFKRANPCPATGLSRGACVGYIVDHIIPLCACGLDRPQNMQWQTYKASKAKDAYEVRLCAGEMSMNAYVKRYSN